MSAPLISLAAMLLTPEAFYTASPEAAAQYEVVDPRYRACIERIDENIDVAREEARRWIGEAGGAPAHHCLAVADLAAGLPMLAAVRLVELSDRPDVGDALVRARVLAQAALAWLDAGQKDQADNAINAALAATPNAAELNLIAARIHLANERWQNAVDAVTKAEEAGVVSTDGFVKRARALLSLGKPREAADDVVAALGRDPFHLDALVLRGELQQIGIAINANYQREIE